MNDTEICFSTSLKMLMQLMRLNLIALNWVVKLLDYCVAAWVLFQTETRARLSRSGPKHIHRLGKTIQPLGP